MKHKPLLAAVPDIEEQWQLDLALECGEQLRPFTQYVLFIPKILGVLSCIPQESWVVIGYSVPTRYSGADPGILAEAAGRPIHLLGGSPHAQLTLATGQHIFSVDGNMAMKVAHWGMTWSADMINWVRKDPEIEAGPGMPYRAFDKSCENIVRAWKRRGVHGEENA